MTAFDYEEDIIQPLISANVPITVFEDKINTAEYGVVVFQEDSKKNLNKVNMTRYNKGQVPFASFHSKLILYEFDDRLRVIISSANLTIKGWSTLSQVIWVQDFPRFIEA